MLEGKYTEDTVFGPNDHRRHRPRSWLINGLKKIEQLQFLVDARPGATLGQVALKWLFMQPAIASALPNIYDREQLAEFAAASELADLTPEETQRIQELYESNFGLEAAVENATPSATAGASR
jgi:aryl-alcohol dehydrogenase-like predicted oxidoreductase